MKELQNEANTCGDDESLFNPPLRLLRISSGVQADETLRCAHTSPPAVCVADVLEALAQEVLMD